MSKPIIILIAAGLLAGCAGSHQVVPATNSAATTQVSQPSAQTPVSPDGCRYIGIIRLTPCKIDFTTSSPGPKKVTVTIEHHVNGTVVQHNDCGGLTGIAKITRVTNTLYRVRAGAMTGTCEARFVFFHNGSREGEAFLKVNNSV